MSTLTRTAGKRSSGLLVPPPRQAEPFSAPDWPAGTLFVHTSDAYWSLHELGCNGRPRPGTLVNVTLSLESGSGGMRDGKVSYYDGRCNLWQFPVRLRNGVTVMLSSRIARNASGDELKDKSTFELVGGELDSGENLKGIHGLPDGGKATITLRARTRRPKSGP